LNHLLALYPVFDVQSTQTGGRNPFVTKLAVEKNYTLLKSETTPKL